MKISDKTNVKYIRYGNNAKSTIERMKNNKIKDHSSFEIDKGRYWRHDLDQKVIIPLVFLITSFSYD